MMDLPWLDISEAVNNSVGFYLWTKFIIQAIWIGVSFGIAFLFLALFGWLLFGR